jgi:hypothetical protein
MREAGAVGAVEDTPGAIGHALVGQHDQPGQIVLAVPMLALAIKQ